MNKFNPIAKEFKIVYDVIHEFNKIFYLRPYIFCE